MHKKPHNHSIFLFFESLFRVRYVCLGDDYNFDKTMFAPLKEMEVKKTFSCFNVFFVRLISLSLEPFDSRGIFINRFSIKKVKIVNVIIAINVLHVKRL